MPLTLRRAGPEDLATIVEYNVRLAQESEGKTLDRALLKPGVRAVLGDPVRGTYYLAEIGGEVVGQLLITTEWSDWRNGWFWWIQSVYVREDARRKGVFRALYDHVAAQARERQDVVGLRLYVEHANQAAQATYHRVGMQPAGYFVLERSPL